MKDKYKMDVDGNIYYAKKVLVDSIWKLSNFIGIPISYGDTHEIYNGMSVRGLSVKDVIAVNNIKNAWKFILESIDERNGSVPNTKVSLMLLRNINNAIGKGIICRPVDFRTGDIRIGGTDWKPDIPDIISLNRRLSEILSIKCDTDRAISLMLFVMRSHLFWGGNERTAIMCGNYELIKCGRGIFSIPINKKDEFRSLVIAYYETGGSDAIKAFIYDNCIEGSSL